MATSSVSASAIHQRTPNVLRPFWQGYWTKSATSLSAFPDPEVHAHAFSVIRYLPTRDSTSKRGTEFRYAGRHAVEHAARRTRRDLICHVFRPGTKP